MFSLARLSLLKRTCSLPRGRPIKNNESQPGLEGPRKTTCLFGLGPKGLYWLLLRSCLPPAAGGIPQTSSKWDGRRRFVVRLYSAGPRCQGTSGDTVLTTEKLRECLKTMVTSYEKENSRGSIPRPRQQSWEGWDVHTDEPTQPPP